MNITIIFKNSHRISALEPAKGSVVKLSIGMKWGCFLTSMLLTACNTIGRQHLDADKIFDPATAALLEDIRNGNEIHARKALAGGLSLNIQGKEGITPLEWLIIETRDKEAIRLGLALGANPNFKDGDGDAVINIVSGFKDHEWLLIMLDSGSDPNILGSNGQPPLFGAITEDRREGMTLLLARGADINAHDTLGRNSALYAAYLNKYETVYWLITHGACSNEYDDIGANLAWNVYFSETIMSKTVPAYPWLLKVKHVLEQQGTTFPPPSPQEIRNSRKLQ